MSELLPTPSATVALSIFDRLSTSCVSGIPTLQLVVQHSLAGVSTAAPDVLPTDDATLISHSFCKFCNVCCSSKFTGFKV